MKGEVLEGPFAGAWRVKLGIIGNPKVSIVIPTKDKVEYLKRAIERDAPIDSMLEFNASDWSLMTAEVDYNKGKFVSSAWQRKIDGRSWWIVIGLNEVVMTVIETDKRGVGDEIIREGAFYTKVEFVNRNLMNKEVDRI